MVHSPRVHQGRGRGHRGHPAAGRRPRPGHALCRSRSGRWRHKTWSLDHRLPEGATQLRRGTKHHTPPRSSRRPTSEPDAPPSSARPKKGARKQLALAAVLAARPPRRPVSALLFYAAEHRARIKMEAPHLEEMEAVRAEFELLDAEGLAKYEALVQQDVERFRRECEERGIDPDELMSRPARRPDELRR